jgi:hypothetical protein
MCCSKMDEWQIVGQTGIVGLDTGFMTVVRSAGYQICLIPWARLSPTVGDSWVSACLSYQHFSLWQLRDCDPHIARSRNKK